MNQDNNQFDDEVDLKELFSIILNRKIFVGAFTSIAAIMSVVYSLYLPDVYTSDSLLAPTSNDESMASSLGGLSNLANLAGVSIPAGSISDSQLAVKRIQSFEFFSKYFLPNIKIEDLMAVKEWMPENNELIYKEDIFNNAEKKWVRNVSFPRKTIPSAQEAFKEYQKILFINQEEDTGLVYISIDHKSAYIAKEWIDVIIFNINESMREIDKLDAENSIKFLSEASNKTSIQSVKLVISKLMESQMQTLMIANSNQDYVLKKINSPIVPEEKSGPFRALICIIGTILGFILSVITVLIQYFRTSSKN